MVQLRLPVFFALAALTACSTDTTSNPARTATEQMLISSAAERSASALTLAIPKDQSVFIDGTNFEGTDSKYAISAIHDSLLRQGIRLADDKKSAQTVVEIRSGALSTDEKVLLVGTPSFSVPVPFASSALPFPEIALYKNDDQIGVAKFAFTAYDAKTGALMQSQVPQFGFAHNSKRVIAIFFSYDTNDILPGEDGNYVTRNLDNKIDKVTSPNG